ncbi:hypothetical protein PR202_ga24718 [Eleusine coracana subsp. coracana]|uniref:Uncharacterized protein n=1 Tax=Eleusine coracana subsp. coracana TaxID=191504 RepID=A0AAV5DA99_ELECO|nr:hypothetical protein QOZ80_9AG0675560 [Eleusine coracana subsp. coracana]GJN06940.1 hypothetical protein PR202_ga24718 [Eleusine coracana subsp. coracana]
MSHRRRFLNMVIANDVGGMYCMRRVDLHASDNSLFYLSAAEAVQKDPKKKKKMVSRIRARGNATLFSGRCTEWVPLSERKMVYMDHRHSRGAAVLYNCEDRSLDALPDIQSSQASRVVPILFYGAGAGDEGGDTVYVMDRSPKPAGDDDDDANNNKFQFQALVRRQEKDDGSNNNQWRRDALPPPPYVHDGGYKSTCIDSHVLLGGDASRSDVLLCVSTEGIGTFSFDTARRTWWKVGDWALPFSGKIEHVLELGVLVGFWGSDEHGHRRLCDCSDQLVPSARPMLRSWIDLEPPCAEWVKLKAPQLISLGSSKFCVAEFFKTTTTVKKGTDEWFTLLTGVEVMGRRGHQSDVGIRVIKHKSKRYVSTNSNNPSATVEFVL